MCACVVRLVTSQHRVSLITLDAVSHNMCHVHTPSWLPLEKVSVHLYVLCRTQDGHPPRPGGIAGENTYIVCKCMYTYARLSVHVM